MNPFDNEKFGGLILAVGLVLLGVAVVATLILFVPRNQKLKCYVPYFGSDIVCPKDGGK